MAYRPLRWIFGTLTTVLLIIANTAFCADIIKIGVHESKPLSFTSEGGALEGIYPEVITQIAKQAEWQIDLISVSWLEGLEMTRNGELDLLGPIAATKQRRLTYNFNKEPVITDWGQVYLPKSSSVKTIIDLKDKTIAYQKGHIMFSLLSDMLHRFDIKFTAMPVDNQQTVFKMIADGRADAGAVNRLFGLLNGKQYPVKKSAIIYAPLEILFAAPKTGDPKTLRQLDIQLEKLKTGKNSTYSRILNRNLLGFPQTRGFATLKQVMIFAGIGLLAVLVILLWTLSLKTKVNSRTRELAQQTRELKKTNRLLNAVMETTTDAIFIKDLEGRYILANTSTCKALGRPLDDVIGKTDTALFPTASADTISSVDNRVIQTGRTAHAEEKLDTAAYGETWWMSNKSPYRDEKNAIIGLIGISRNITDAKTTQIEKDKLQDQLRQAHKMEAIGTLAGGIAHDFNNLLGIIIGNSELALEDLPKGDPVQTNLSEINTASLRARDVVRQLLSFSRKTKKEKKRIYVSTIVRECIKLLRSSIPSTIEIKLDLFPDPLPIEADPTQVHQVIINLCTNAAQAMADKGGLLEIRLSNTTFLSRDAETWEPGSSKKYVQLEVSDTGQGIDPEYKDRVFDPYFTTKEVGQGTGIGLSVVHGIIENHEGRISIYSEPDKGTTVKVLLPAGPKDKTRDEPTAVEIPKGDETILFIDDEISIVKMGKTILEKQGYQVVGESDPQKALDIFISDPDRFDLVITDLTMPNLTGDRLAAHLLKHRADIPIIISTGFSRNITKELAHKVGIKNFLEKPFDLTRLLKTVRNTLDE